jgi:hypothetical protein
LEDELQWPDAEKRQELAVVLPGMFHGCIGVADVKESQVVKYLDPIKEKNVGVGRRKSITIVCYGSLRMLHVCPLVFGKK